MYLSKLFSRFLLISLMFLVPSCIKYHKILKKEFNQGQDHNDNREVAHNYIRSATVYDQFETRGIFNALWMADDVRAAYADVYCDKRGRSSEGKDALLKRLLEENKHWITFYMLADIRDRVHSSLSEKTPAWTMYLDVGNGEKIDPVSIKEVELDPEYQFFFGYRFNLSKVAYLVKFPAQDLSGVSYVKQGGKVNLVLSSVSKEVELVWDLSKIKKGEKLIKDEDFYWI